MKKITLLLALVFSSSLMFAQVLSEDFEGGLSLPAGWTNNDIAVSSEIWTFETGGEAPLFTPGNTDLYTVALMSGNYAIFNSDAYGNNATAEEAALESPVFDCSSLTNVQLSLNHFFVSGYGGEGYVEVYNGSVWIEVAAFSEVNVAANTAESAPIVLDVTTELSGVTNAQVRFRWVGDWSYYWVIDNIVVEEGPTCFTPTDFVIGPNGVTTTSFDIEWMDANGAGTVFDIEWGEAGFTLGSGTMVNDLAATNYDFTGLMPDTDYEFYITANCTGGLGDSDQVGPITFTSAYDCATYGLPFSDDFSSQNGFAQCYEIEDANADTTTWGYNNGNDVNGDAMNDPIALIFPPDPTVAKDDWLFLPVFGGVAGADYELTVTYNAFDNPVAASESFEIVALDAPSSTAAMQTVVGTYNSITQVGAGVADLEPNAYSSSATYTPAADGDFYFALHATTPAATSAILMVFTLNVSETLSIDDFERNTFTHSYNKNLEVLNLESSNMAMTNIEIYSLLGQNVISRPLSNTYEAIDVSSLNDGVYLAKVFVEGGSKTIKFVKN